MRHHYPHFSRLFHFTSLIRSFFAESPEEVNADAAFDGAADILRHHQAIQGLLSIRPGGGEEYRCALRDGLRINGDASAGGQRNAKRTDRPGRVSR